jgi:hypothetical protein
MNCRRYLEHIGFWGAPGTPSPNVTAPVPVLPYSIPTMGSATAYKEAYPTGFDAPYPWYSDKEVQSMVAELHSYRARSSASFRPRFDFISILVGANSAVHQLCILKKFGVSNILGHSKRRHHFCSAVHSVQVFRHPLLGLFGCTGIILIVSLHVIDR